MSPTIGFIGGGRVTKIFLSAWQRVGFEQRAITVSDVAPAVLDRLKAKFPEVTVTTENRKSADREFVFLALHPPAIRTALPELAGALNPGAIVVSLAPVITFNELSRLLNGFPYLVRMIPNAPAMLGKGYSPVAYAPALTEEQRNRLKVLFAPLGEYPEVKENTLEAYAILTGMGPTYFWFQWQTLREMGKSFGLASEDVDRALKAMIDGSAQLLFDSGFDPAEVMDTIPVKPLAELEYQITALYQEKLPGSIRNSEPPVASI